MPAIVLYYIVNFIIVLIYTYRIARNVGGVKLWRINEILHWRRKLWRITYFGDQVKMSGGRREMLVA